MNAVYVTGNHNKARYFSEILGLDIPHEAADVEEIQSLDPEEVVTAKVREAYKQIGKPVIVEDTSFVIESMGRLPGTFIKWFIEEIGCEGICRLADKDPERKATASAIFVYYDGIVLESFKGSFSGKVSMEPRGASGFGWNQIFIPDGHDQTLGEMEDETFKNVYTKIKPFYELRDFLEKT